MESSVPPASRSTRGGTTGGMRDGTCTRAPATRTSTAREGPATAVADSAKPAACVRSIQAIARSAPRAAPSNPRARLPGTADSSMFTRRGCVSPADASTSRTSALDIAVAALSESSRADHRNTDGGACRAPTGRLARYIASANASNATVRSIRSSHRRARCGVDIVIG